MKQESKSSKNVAHFKHSHLKALLDHASLLASLLFVTLILINKTKQDPSISKFIGSLSFINLINQAFNFAFLRRKTNSSLRISSILSNYGLIMWSLTASSSIVLVSFVIISTTILMLNSLVRFAFSINPIDQSFYFFPSYAIYVRSSLFNAHTNTFTPLGWLSYLAATLQPIMICLDYLD